MNVAKALEITLSTVLRAHGRLLDSVLLRCFQTLDHDGIWTASQDRTFPVVDIRARPPQTDENQSTLRCDVTILVATLAADDASHDQLSGLYELVQSMLDNLFAQARAGSGSVYDSFLALMGDRVDSGKFLFGGFTFGDTLSPYEENGANMMGVTLSVHYGRDDF